MATVIPEKEIKHKASLKKARGKHGDATNAVKLKSLIADLLDAMEDMSARIEGLENKK